MTDAYRIPDARSLTGRLLGDPDPARFTRSEARRRDMARRLVAPATTSVTTQAVVERQYQGAPPFQALQALADRPGRPSDIAPIVGVTENTAYKYIKAAKAAGHVAQTGQSRGGVSSIAYHVTDEGRAHIARMLATGVHYRQPTPHAEVREKILAVLAAASCPLRLTEIAQACGVAPANLSHHLPRVVALGEAARSGQGRGPDSSVRYIITDAGRSAAKGCA